MNAQYVVGIGLIATALIVAACSGSNAESSGERAEATDAQSVAAPNCFTEEEESALAGEIIPHGLQAGDSLPGGILEILDIRGFDVTDFERTAFREGAVELRSTDRLSTHPNVAEASFVLVLLLTQPDLGDASPTEWAAEKISLMVCAE